MVYQNGAGKPEPLRHRKAWSRRIAQEHRLVYNFDENKNLIIYSCRGHYED
jgi:toxin YoeB